MDNTTLLNHLLAQEQIRLGPAPFLKQAPPPLPEYWDFERVECMLLVSRLKAGTGTELAPCEGNHLKEKENVQKLFCQSHLGRTIVP